MWVSEIYSLCGCPKSTVRNLLRNLLSSYCTVTEIQLDSAAEGDDSDCANLPIGIAQGNSCTIYNTVFFEGIPALNRYGMLLLALLMLGVGVIGFRRFS
jgi:hypothetical protein